jgi:hypothetical protein
MADEQPQEAQEPTVVDATVQDKKEPGPIRKILWLFSRDARANSKHMKENQRIMYGPDPEEEDTDDFRRQRRLIETFSEDYLGWADRAKLAAAKFVAFLLPVAAVAAVGTDIGAFFAPALGTFSSYTLAYSIEAGLAALTLMLGMAAQKTNEGTSHWVKVGIAGFVWLIASLASGLVMYVIAATALPASVLHTSLGSAIIFLRTGAVMLIDLISVSILFFRGKSLQKYLHEMSQKSHAITATNEAELAIKRAQETAKQRQREDEQYLEGKARAQAVVSELQEMTNQALIDVARRNLLKSPDEGNNRRIGRY